MAYRYTVGAFLAFLKNVLQYFLLLWLPQIPYERPCVYGHFHSDRCQDTVDIELIPEREDTQPDSPLEDTVSVTLKRENSIRRSQRNGRLEDLWGQGGLLVGHRSKSLLLQKSLCLLCLFSSSFSVRLRKNSSIRKPENADESKKGQRLIEKETMETGQVI